MAKKKGKELTLEEKLEQALVPREEWPYEVPENWCWCKLGSIIKVSSGKNLTTKKMNTNGKIPVFGGNGITGFHDIGNVDGINIIIGRVGAYCGSVYYIEGTAWVTDNALIVSYNEEKIFSKFLYWLLSFSNLRENDSSSAQPVISGKKIYDIDIPLPPLPEQQRIVECIENLYAKLDEAKEKVQAVLDESEKRKAAILHKAFSGELTEKWRKKKAVIQNTSFKDYNAKTIALSKKEKKIINTFQAEVESFYLKDGTEWYKCSIGAISIVSNGSTPSRKCQEYWGGDIHWVSSGEVNNNIITDTREKITKDGFDNSSVKLLPAGTVLIAMIGEGKTRGRSSILNIPATTNQNIAAIQVESTCVDSKFLWYWLQMQYKKNREKGSGTGPQALNCQRVRELEFIVPSINEQREISMIIDKLIKVETEISIIAEEFVEKIDIIKKSILAKAFRGELGTNDLSEQTSIELLKEIL